MSLSKCSKAIRQMINLLLDELPISYNGQIFNSDFKSALRFLAVCENDEASDEERAVAIARIFFNDKVPDSDGIWDFISSFINKRGGDDAIDIGGKKVFDFGIKQICTGGFF